MGHYSCIQAAINATTKSSNERFVIYVKKGLYRENIEVGINVNNIIMLVAGALEGATPPTTQQLQVKCFFFFLREVTLWVRFNLFEKLDSKYMI